MRVPFPGVMVLAVLAVVVLALAVLDGAFHPTEAAPAGSGTGCTVCAGEDEAAALNRALAALPEGERWATERLRKRLDDLGLPAAVGGRAAFSQVEYPSTDGLRIPAYLFLPTGTKGPGPAVIYVHGSQHGQFTSRNLARVLALVDRGYAVLAPDYRSSAGYGPGFYAAADYGGLEIDDLLAARDWLAGLPAVDPARIAILGLSHGGYNVLMSLARAPGAFAAGVDFFGPTDLVWRLTAPPGTNPNAEADDRAEFERMVGRSFDEAPELYRARSPRYLAERITTPLLILHGDKDSVVLIRESEWMAAALDAAGRGNYRFQVMPGGEHGYPAGPMDEGWALAFDFLAGTLGPATPAGR